MQILLNIEEDVFYELCPNDSDLNWEALERVYGLKESEASWIGGRFGSIMSLPDGKPARNRGFCLYRIRHVLKPERDRSGILKTNMSTTKFFDRFITVYS